MPERIVAQTVLFPTLFEKPLVATFDTPQQSPDGGATLLEAIDDELHLSAALVTCIPEWREAGKIEHDLPSLNIQWCFGLTYGCADANDAAHRKTDPIHKLLVGRDPRMGPEMASQPTLSRFENVVDARELSRLTRTVADVVFAHRHAQLGARRVRRITVNLTPWPLVCITGNRRTWPTLRASSKWCQGRGGAWSNAPDLVRPNPENGERLAHPEALTEFGGYTPRHRPRWLKD